MCGIFGHLNFNKSGLQNSRDALHVLTHRGPDQWGDWYDEHVYLGHRRLSILDLSDSAKQPMSSGDDSVIITVNGEIYNFKELKKDLIQKYNFKSKSDSEVVLYGYKEWGIEGLLEKMEGMFAFCIYDKIKRKIFLVRDRVGIKPLYYFSDANSFCWGSELKAIEKYVSSSSLLVDYTSLYDYLTYGFIPSPKTLYKNCFKLIPGNYLELDIGNNHFATHQYWQLKISKPFIKNDFSCEGVRNEIRKSVNSQMLSDVPVGFFLSGGMDSSILVYEAAQGGEPLNTFNISFKESSHDESNFADIVARKCGTNHISEMITGDITEQMRDEYRKWYDEPHSDTSAFPTFLVSNFAKKHATVVLTGDGGDEIFGGYKRYNKFCHYYNKRTDLFPAIKSKLNLYKNKKTISGRLFNKLENHLLKDDLELYAKLRFGMIKIEKIKYACIWDIPQDYDDYWYFRQHYQKNLPIRTRLQVLDINTVLPDDYLTKVDRTSMANSLEARVPFLSTPLIEYFLNMPEDLRLVGNILKGIVKKCYHPLLPQAIIEKPKKGFSIPLNKWFGSKQFSYSSSQEFLLYNIWGDKL